MSLNVIDGRKPWRRRALRIDQAGRDYRLGAVIERAKI
jgi:hypothetical protein